MPALQGAKHHAAKMDARRVRAARKAHADGKASINGLAKKYGIAYQTMRAIIHRETWKHVT